VLDVAEWSKDVFAKNLRRYADRSGKTQRDLAEVAGVSTATFSDWINGKKFPRIDKIELLARYFGIKKSDLIEEKMTSEKEKDNDIITDAIVRMRTDNSFLSLVEALITDAEFLSAVQSLHTLDPEKAKGVQDMLKAFVK
jgi:repressor LexA